jgi:methylated-DNA-[protein]-cysteine S-methyltransferase
MNAYFYEYPVGIVGIAEDDGAITNIFFGKDRALANGTIGETPLIKQAAAQLDEYFAGNRTEFDLPLAIRGTDFQRSVWTALRAIPFGQTRSYGQIAEVIGHRKAYRAVGMANHRNPLAIVIPCHRVVEHGGGLGGYGGGLPAKLYLLELEKRVRIEMEQ